MISLISFGRKGGLLKPTRRTRDSGARTHGEVQLELAVGAVERRRQHSSPLLAALGGGASFPRLELSREWNANANFTFKFWNGRQIWKKHGQDNQLSASVSV